MSTIPRAVRVASMPQDDWNKVLPLIGATAAGGAAVGVVKSAIYRRYGSFWQWLGMLFASALVAVLVGLGIDGTDLSRNQQAAVIGICSYLAEDILMGFGALAAMFARDPLGTVRKVWSALRGKGDSK